MSEDYNVQLNSGQQFAKDDYDNIQFIIIHVINLKALENMKTQY